MPISWLASKISCSLMHDNFFLFTFLLGIHSFFPTNQLLCSASFSVDLWPFHSKGYCPKKPTSTRKVGWSRRTNDRAKKEATKLTNEQLAFLLFACRSLLDISLLPFSNPQYPSTSCFFTEQIIYFVPSRIGIIIILSFFHYYHFNNFFFNFFSLCGGTDSQKITTYLRFSFWQYIIFRHLVVLSVRKCAMQRFCSPFS